MNTRRPLMALSLLVYTSLSAMAHTQANGHELQRACRLVVASHKETVYVQTTIGVSSPTPYYRIQLKTKWDKIHDYSLCCSMFFDWTFLLSGSEGCGFDEERNHIDIASLSADVHKSMCLFLSACAIPYETPQPLPPQQLPFVSEKARAYFVSRLFRTWRAVGMFGGPRPCQWNWVVAPYKEAGLKRLIQDYSQFPARFPKDRYLSAYAELCSAILQAHQPWLFKTPLDRFSAERFTQIEAKYPDLSEVGLMSSWWKAMYLVADHPQQAKEAFQHIADKYRGRDWWVVDTAVQASKVTQKEWIKMGLIEDQHSGK